IPISENVAAQTLAVQAQLPCNFKDLRNNTVPSIHTINAYRGHWKNPNRLESWMHSVDFMANGSWGFVANAGGESQTNPITCGTDTRAYAVFSGKVTHRNDVYGRLYVYNSEQNVT